MRTRFFVSTTQQENSQPQTLDEIKEHVALTYLIKYFIEIRKWMRVSPNKDPKPLAFASNNSLTPLLRGLENQAPKLQQQAQQSSRDGIHDHDSLIPSWFNLDQTALHSFTRRADCGQGLKSHRG